MLNLAVEQSRAGNLGEKQRQKGLAPAKAYKKDIKMIHCWNNGWLCDWQLNQLNRCLQRPQTQAEILSSSSSLLLCCQCKQVCISGPHNQRNCCLSKSWTHLRSDSFRKECVWLGGNCGPTSCVNILSVPLKSPSRISIHFCVATGLCLSNTATWLTSSFPIS